MLALIFHALQTLLDLLLMIMMNSLFKVTVKEIVEGWQMIKILIRLITGLLWINYD